MKKLLVGVGLSLVLAAFVACAQGGTQSTPSADARYPHQQYKVCHHDADLSEGAYEWTVVYVNRNSLDTHCDGHGDFMTNTSWGCSYCADQYLEVGADCSICPYLGSS